MKPATPLPWKDGPVFQREGRALFWTDTSKPGKWQRRLDLDKDGVIGQQDAAYIVHACNHHEELVAALREIRQEVIMIVEDGTIPPSALSHPSMKKAEALLRELGELK